MTDTDHLDEPGLVAVATHAPLDARGAEHLGHCASCRQELETWRRISTVVTDAVASSAAAGDDLTDRILGRLGSPPEEVHLSKGRSPALPPRARVRRPQWLVAAIGVATAGIIAIALTLGPSSPSQAVILKRIRSTAVLAARWKTMHITASEVLRAPRDTSPARIDRQVHTARAPMHSRSRRP